MKTYCKLARRSSSNKHAHARPWAWHPQIARPRKGTVIIIVLALLAMLAFIGVFIFSFTASENQSATYFSNSPTAKPITPSLNADAFFDDILRQIIVGPGITERQSALWGGRHSLLPTMFGRDLAAFNGSGVNLVWNTTATANTPANMPAVDQNLNGKIEDGTQPAPDTADNRGLLQLNFSPAAQGADIDFNNFPAAGIAYPDPDTNATYPDQNSTFLAYDAMVPQGTGNPIRVVIPSFHRPALLRNVTAVANWYSDPLTTKLVLYPHTEHLAVDSTGAVSTVQRFMSPQHPAAVGADGQPGVAGVDDDSNGTVDDASELGWPGSDDVPNIGMFPFPGVLGGPAAVQEGVWTNIGDPINYGVDVDNDGVVDARYMDFGFPLMTTPDGATQFVALAAVKIIDADSLFNLNVHGNRSQAVVVPTPIGTPFGGVGSGGPGTSNLLSLSDQGASTADVNPEWGLNARPVSGGFDFPGTPAALATALQQHTLFFRTPPDSTTLPVNNFDKTAGLPNYELANMEWWNLLSGRPQLAPGATPLVDPAVVNGSSISGRWGESTSRLDPAVQAVLAGGPVQAGAGIINDPFPLPGTSLFDDNKNADEGGTYGDLQGLVHPAFVQPLDVFTSGSFITGAGGKVRQLVTQGSEKFPAYTNFVVNNTEVWPQLFGTALMPGAVTKKQIDEPTETFIEPSSAAAQTNDSIFQASENALQLSAADFTALGNPGRAASLASFNMVANARAALVRQKFTSTSWDLKAYGKEFFGAYGGSPADDNALRRWEFTQYKDAQTPTPGVWFQFPPAFPNSSATAVPYAPTATQPFRSDLAGLLQVIVNPNPIRAQFSSLTSNPPVNTTVAPPQRLMSINHIVQQGTAVDPSTGQSYPTFQFRPLTPHPTGAAWQAASMRQPIAAFPTDSSGKVITRPEQLTPGSLPQQEWLARYDRQRLARDIYVLLYTLGGGSDTTNYTLDNTTRNLYSEDQLLEMAQFAVNWVDALDPDDHITLFEYDKNLADGWNLDDNPYDSTGDSIPVNDRGLVYGVERQTLCINEALVTFAKQVVNPSLGNTPIDHPDTQWKDDQGHFGFFYVELENVGPQPVSFINQGWQIAVKESPIVVPSGFYGQETRMTIGTGQPAVPAGVGSRMTIGTEGGTLNGTSFIANMNTTVNPNVPYPSWFVVDPNDQDALYKGTQYDQQFPIAPRGALTSLNGTTPGNITTNANALDLDMVLQPANCFVMPTDGAGNDSFFATPATYPGTQFLQFSNMANIQQTSQIVLRVELRRRADLSRTPPVIPSDAASQTASAQQSADNPWIVVDYMDVPLSKFILTFNGNGSDVTQLSGQIQPILKDKGTPGPVSTERSQPLFHDYNLNPYPPGSTVAFNNRNGGAATRNDAPPAGPPAPALYQANSLGQDNDAADNDNNPTTPIPPHSLWQPHYDRDFSSVGELFNIPLYGPYCSVAAASLASPASISKSATSGLTHRMAAKRTETGAALPVESLVGDDYDPVGVAAGEPAGNTHPAGRYNGFGTAGYRFQHPEGNDPANPSPTADFTENRWFRILGFLEVPSRWSREQDNPWYRINAGSIGGPLGIFRTPGKINVNTLRYPEVLGGLVDDNSVLTMLYTPAPVSMYTPVPPAGASPSFSFPYLLPDINGDQVPLPALATRDWWLQFIAARDGVDPITGLPLPGVPKVPASAVNVPPQGSHPFRSLAFAAASGGVDGSLDTNGYNGALESTILRALPGDQITPAQPDSRRRLFEVGTATDHAGNAVDYATKHRLLSKLIGNTTTRSNVFFVWIQIDFFQAKDVGPSLAPPQTGVIRVGAKLGTGGASGTSPAYRGFFVVDRSQALALVNQQSLPTVDPTTGKFIFSFNQSFNYKSLILYRQRIQ